MTTPALDRALRLSARLRLRARDPEKAGHEASEALAFSKRLARNERESADVGEALLIRAQSHAAAGRTADALADVRPAVEALRAGYGPEHPLTVTAVDLLSTLSTESASRR